MKLIVFIFVLVALCSARVPPRNHEIEVTPDSTAFRSPTLQVNPDSESSEEDKSDQSKNKVNRLPINVLLFRRPTMFLEPPNFSRSEFEFPRHNTFKILSMLLGNRRPFSYLPSNQSESEESDEIIPNSFSSAASDHSFERLFPRIFVGFPQFETPDTDVKPESEESSPNFEKKEKKVVTGSDGKKYVKTIHEKKMKNDFGNFHSVISSYVPFDENIHDENGEEKNPKGSNKNTTLDKKEDSNEVNTELNEKPTEDKSSSIGEETKLNEDKSKSNGSETKLDEVESSGESLENDKRPKTTGKEVEDKPLTERNKTDTKKRKRG